MGEKVRSQSAAISASCSFTLRMLLFRISSENYLQSCVNGPEIAEYSAPKKQKNAENLQLYLCELEKTNSHECSFSCISTAQKMSTGVILTGTRKEQERCNQNALKTYNCHLRH